MRKFLAALAATMCILALSVVGQIQTKAPMELDLTAYGPRVLIWDALFLDVRAKNLGNKSMPFGPGLLDGYDQGASLLIVVHETEAPDVNSRKLALDPPGETECDEGQGVRLAPGDEDHVSASLGGSYDVLLNETKTDTRRIFVPLFEHPGSYAVRAEYSYAGSRLFSNEIVIEVVPPSGEEIGELEQVKALGLEAGWLYEPTMIPFGIQPERLEALMRIAGGRHRYADLAGFSLANFYLRNATAYVDDKLRIGSREDCLRNGRQYLGRLATSSLAGTPEFAELSKALHRERR